MSKIPQGQVFVYLRVHGGPAFAGFYLFLAFYIRLLGCRHFYFIMYCLLHLVVKSISFLAGAERASFLRQMM